MEGGDNQYLSHPLFLQDKFSSGVPGGQKGKVSATVPGETSGTPTTAMPQ